jgi:MFS family permease
VTPARLGPNYRRLWSAAAVSNLGDGVTLAALPLLAASITRDPTKVALVSVAATLPWLLFALVGGAIADRVDRRRAMAITDGFRMLAMAALGVAVLAGFDRLWVLAAVSFVLGSAQTVFDNAAQAILPSVVTETALETANGRLAAAETLTNQFVGPPLGAFLFAAAASAPFFLDAASFGLAALLVLLLRGRFRTPRPDGPLPTMRADIAEALRWLWHHTLLRTLAIALGVMNLLEEAIWSMLVLYTLEVLHLSAAGYGVLLASTAVGALVGSFCGAALSRRLGAGRVLLLAVFGWGSMLLIPAIWANTIAVGVALAIAAFFGVLWNVVTVSLRQSLVPDQMLGRVNSAYRMMSWGTIPLGALLGGLLASTFGLRAPFAVGGVVTLVTGIVLVPWVGNRAITAARAAAQIAAGSTPTDR